MATQPLPITILPDYQDADSYSDGAEDRLLAIFRDPDPSAVERAVAGIIAGSPSWPERAHLSPQRHHLLDWYPFEGHARLLEVGAGCGAMTGLFARRVAHVVALDTSAKRATILAHRHRRLANVQVLVGDLAGLAAQQPTFDYIVLIGVLEYAGRYVTDEGDNRARDPYVRMLAQAQRMLARDGVLLLAIENQLGLKYVSGYDEDHYGRPLVGIEDYLADRGVRTFGRGELAELLHAVGLSVMRWYYPFPDYKLPTSIYSDEQPLGSIDHIGVMYPTIDYANRSESYFAESRFARVLGRNALTHMFANSFLVVCKSI